MKKIMNIKTFAELAGVSTATVSRVFAHDPKVRPQTAEQVRALAKKYGFRPNLIAQTPFNGKTRSIGVLLWRLSNSFFADIALGIQQTLLPEGYLPIIISTRTEADCTVLQHLVDHRVDGLIACLKNLPLSKEELQEIKNFNLPLVAIEYYQNNISCDMLQPDNEACGQIAAQYFLSHGHHSLGVLCGDYKESLRSRAFVAELKRQGISLPESAVLPESSPEAIRRFLKQNPDLTGIFCVNDIEARKLYDVCATLHLSIPADLSIIGTNDLDFADCLTPKLTTIRTDGIELGRQAGTLILQRLQNREKPFCNVITNVKLVERNSVAKRNRLHGTI